MEKIFKMNVEQKSLVLLPFPFSDLKTEKVRPALVISNNIFNNKSADCLMVPLTSVLREEPYSLIINQEDLFSGHLLKTSRIKIDKIFSVEKELIITNIGLLQDETFEKIKSKIFKIF